MSSIECSLDTFKKHYYNTNVVTFCVTLCVERQATLYICKEKSEGGKRDIR